jgi:hypothetical protein
MGLFSKKHTEHENAPITGTSGYNNSMSTAPGTGAAGLNNYDDPYTNTGTNTGITGRHHDSTTAGLGHHHADPALANTTRGGYGDDAYAGTGTGGMTGTHHHGTDATSTRTSSAGGGMKALEGKIERGLGTMVGSASLKAKGIEKEQEAAAMKVQAAHLERAERLETEAATHRDRAVAYGAPAEHRHVGGVRPSGDNSAMPGEQMVSQPGGGGYGGNPVLPGGGASAGRSAF